MALGFAICRVRFYRTYEGLKLTEINQGPKAEYCFYRTYEGLKPDACQRLA